MKIGWKFIWRSVRKLENSIGKNVLSRVAKENQIDVSEKDNDGETCLYCLSITPVGNKWCTYVLVCWD